MFRDDASLLDILNACRAISEFTEGLSFDQYLADYKTQLSVERLFEIIGEAARRVSAEYIEVHDDLPWTKMIGMRNIMAHQYDNIDFEVVWKVIRVDIPDLMRRIEPLVPPEQ
jgi:uncharacterized protein with HEPN domain